MSDRPRLTRTGRIGWQLAGTGLLVQAGTHPWRISALDGPNRTWLAEQGLDGAEFDTRSAAVACAAAHMERCPPPAPAPPARLFAVGAGAYASKDGKVQVARAHTPRRIRGCQPWRVYGHGRSMMVPTLEAAAVAAARLARPPSR
jgi:hypothetical protein